MANMAVRAQQPNGVEYVQQPVQQVDQFPAFAARLEELRIGGSGGVGYPPQLQQVDTGSDRQGSLGWFRNDVGTWGGERGVTLSPINGPQLNAVSPVDQRQQSPWQIQLPGISETSQSFGLGLLPGPGTGITGSNRKEEVFELSGDDVNRYVDEKRLLARNEQK
jgi:hypothetical protein